MPCHGRDVNPSWHALRKNAELLVAIALELARGGAGRVILDEAAVTRFLSGKAH
jgi:hypothetical protein